MVNCPRCGKQQKDERGLAIHWSKKEDHPGTLEEHYPQYGGTFTEEHRQKLSKSHRGKVLTEEHKENISEGVNASLDQMKRKLSDGRLSGSNNPMYGEKRSEEVKNKISESLKGRIRSEESRQKNSESTEDWWELLSEQEYQDLMEVRSESLKGKKPPKAQKRFVDKLGHRVDSVWEEIVAEALYSRGIDYVVEPEYKIGEGRSYYPDFETGRVVIEVKGYADDRSVKRAQLFLDRYPEKYYVVVGDRTPCDEFVKCNSREELEAKVGQVVQVVRRVGGD